LDYQKFQEEHKMKTVARIRLAVLIVLLGLVGACNSQPVEPPTTAAQPSISDPMISDPTPQEPGKEVGISVDVSSAGGVTLTYTWNADGGEIVRGQGSPAITYRVPQEPGTYNVRVKVEWDGQSTEKVTSIQVKRENLTTTPTSQSNSTSMEILWGDRVRVSDSNDSSAKYRSPSIVIDSTGNPKIAWHDSHLGSGDIFFDYSTDGGHSWKLDFLIEDSSDSVGFCGLTTTMLPDAKTNDLW
jgi:hypothetical protein